MVKINNEKLDDILLDLGHTDSVKGTEYIRRAVALYKRDMSITKELYPAIAAQMDTTDARVERAIRHSIEAAWMRNTGDVCLRYFGNTVDPNRGKPTNSEYIARLARLCREN
jgi:two-component system response regulator (stage 0 sporulation protein A)